MPRPSIEKGDIWSSIWNLTNVMLGSTVITYPFVFKQLGVTLGCIAIISFAIVCIYTYQVYARTASCFLHTGKLLPREITFEHVVKTALGPKILPYAALCIICGGFFVMVAYFIIIGDQIIDIITFYGLTKNTSGFIDILLSRGALTFMYALFIVFPLSLYARIQQMRFTSVLALITIFMVILIIWIEGIHALQGNHRSNVEIEWGIKLWKHHSVKDVMGFFASLPIIAFSFAGHPAFMTIFAELEPVHKARVAWTVVLPSVFAVSCVFISVGVLGYVYSGDSLLDSGDILSEYDLSHWYIVLAKICMTMALSFTLPPLLYPVKRAVDSLLFNSTTSSPIRNIIEVFILVISSAIISVVIPSVQVVLSLVGATLGVLIVYIIPALILLTYPTNDDIGYLQLENDVESSSGEGTRFTISKTERIIAYILVIFMIPFCFMCVFSNMMYNFVYN